MSMGIVDSDCTECSSPSAENCKMCLDVAAQAEHYAEEVFVSPDDVVAACAARHVRVSRDRALELIAEFPGSTAKQIGDHVGYIADWGDPLDDPFDKDWHDGLDLDDPAYQAI